MATINANDPGNWIIEAGNEIREGRFTCATRPHKCNKLPRRSPETDVLQCNTARLAARGNLLILCACPCSRENRCDVVHTAIAVDISEQLLIAGFVLERDIIKNNLTLDVLDCYCIRFFSDIDRLSLIHISEP